jgi:hypothetical protein
MAIRRIYTLGLAVALFVSLVWAALAQSKRDTPFVKVATAKDDAIRDLARLLAAHEVYKLHWTTLEASREFRPVIDQLSHDLLDEQFTHRWKVRVLPVSKANDLAADLDEFEKQAVIALHAGQDESWQVEGDGVVRLAKAVRAKTSCLACHQARQEVDGPKYITENETIGIVMLKTFPHDAAREEEAAKELKTGIDNLRKVATRYSDTKEGATVLELLKQLQKKNEATTRRDDE